MVYDQLIQHHVQRKAEKEYLKILHIAAYEGEWKVETIIKILLAKEVSISSAIVKENLKKTPTETYVKDVEICPIDLKKYDILISEKSEGVI